MRTALALALAALVGSGGLGYLFTNGYQRYFVDEIVIGIVFTVLLALVFDAILVLAGRVLLPWVRRRSVGTPRAAVEGRAA